MDNLKLRASWGQTGNERIDAFMYLPQYNTSNVVMNGSLVSAVYQEDGESGCDLGNSGTD
ncbi:hypothetical protein NXW71_12905 [Parabacteroides merdae]|nr:hypothetical protein [Parabacteroides merdae]